MKTPLKSNLINPSIVLGAAILTVVSLLVPVARAADPLMPDGPGTPGRQPFDPKPAAPGSLTRQFMTYGEDADGIEIPVKTVRITNNTEQTVYPIMRDPNSTLTKSKTVGLYDPYDPPNKEYRGYIGYKGDDGKYFFGLKKHESILVRLPLVFWNGGRIGIGTDGKYLAPTGLPNPLNYRSNSQRSITTTETEGDNIKNGVVMWYRADIAEAPKDDAEDQLAEWTIRDHVYLVNPKITMKTNGEIPDNQLVTLINYDVSNVDNLYLPVAMAANDVWVLPQITGKEGNRKQWTAGSHPDVYGWTGAINTIDFLQTKIRAFTKEPNDLLREYFGKTQHGWPFYNIPNNTNSAKAPLKIPSGANVFAQSPLKDVRSSYGTGDFRTDKYMLSSGGTKPVKVPIGWAGGTPDPPNQDIVHLNPIESDRFPFLEEGDLVKGLVSPPLQSPVQDGTTLLKIVDLENGVVKLSKKLINSGSLNTTFEFTRPVDDYASDAMVKLWYSWAQYYLAHWKDRTPGAPSGPIQISGFIQENTATMSFNERHDELVEGMAVTGPGLDDAQTEDGPHQGDAVILQITTDHKTVILSQVANKKSTPGTFTFRPPQSFCPEGAKSGCLLWAPTKEGDTGYPLIGDEFKFSNEPPEHNPYEFSQQVYLIMASMNQIGKPNNDSLSKFMQDIIGANMGFIFTNQAKLKDDGKLVTAMIRDMIKSVLRGVTDFTQFPDKVDDSGNHLTWYPDPKEHHGDQPFNVFNLDPFVWFVHVQLGFSGYGFSVDDDTADVGAGGGTVGPPESQLQISVIETGGLKNLNPWTIQAPYGPVPGGGKTLMLEYSGKAVDCRPECGPDGGIGDTLYHAIENVSNFLSNFPTNPIKITTKGQHHLLDGDTVIIEQVKGQEPANGKFKINNVTSNTFELYDAATGKTPILPCAGCKYTPDTGRWSYPLHAFIDTGDDLTKVFYRVVGDDVLGTFLGTFVSVNGVDRNKKGDQFRVWRLGQQKIREQTVGRLLVFDDLTDADGNPLPRGTYEFSFFGIPEKRTLPGGAPPLHLDALRDDIQDEIDRIRNRLNRLEQRHNDMKNSAQVRRSNWLELRIDVLKARLQYPTDEVLKELEQTVEARKSLRPKGLRNLRQDLNRRLKELGSEL